MELQQIKVLLIDDDEDDYIITRELFSEIRERNYLLEWVRTYDEALRLINARTHEIYLLDYHLGERSGLDLLREAVAAGCTVPIILLTGQGDSDVDMEAMQSGAADYLCKGEINASLLDRSIRYALKHKYSEDRILHMAYYDALTSLPNRSLFNDRLNQALEHAKRYQSVVALLFLDLDNFKRINDTLEHRIGDMLLQCVAERLQRYLRSSDSVARRKSGATMNTVARLGGDEFTILLTEIDSMENAALVSKRILDILSRPYRLEEHEVVVTGSVGIAMYPDDGEDMDILLKNADTAMYHAKELGKNNFQFYKRSMNSSALDRLMLENDLRKALEMKEFTLHYQPRLDLHRGEVVATEALIRWEHPAKGIILPYQFIPLAEETGLIIPLSEWVLRTAADQNRKWQKSNSQDCKIAVSVNISARQFREENFPAIVERVLSDAGLDPRYVELEITESAIMKYPEKTITLLQDLKDMGVQLSMDDFGTGYSSFNYLKQFPLDIIKIDRSFIKDITKKPEDAAIVKAMIAVAQSLKLRVIAEGVETEDQLAFLRKQGCDEMQGFLLSPPVSAGEVEKFFNKGHTNAPSILHS